MTFHVIGWSTLAWMVRGTNSLIDASMSLGRPANGSDNFWPCHESLPVRELVRKVFASGVITSFACLRPKRAIADADGTFVPLGRTTTSVVCWGPCTAQ